MQRLLESVLVVSLGLAVVAGIAASGPALAEGPQTAELGNGGSVKGDISNTPGEQDRIGIDLLAGSDLSIKFVPKFGAVFELLDPDGQTVVLPASKGGKTIVKSFPIGTSGHYEFRVAAKPGAQGLYKLAANPIWSGKITLLGSSGDSFDFVVPAQTRMKGTIKAIRSPGFVPRIDTLYGPEGELLPGPVNGKGSKVSLPWVTATSFGKHTLTIGAASGSGNFKIVLKRKVPKNAATKFDIRNGINVISFANDGVAQIFKTRCASCHTRNHSWGNTYAGVKGRSAAALGRIRSGNMPTDGRLSGAEISLIEQWIKTGRAR